MRTADCQSLSEKPEGVFRQSKASRSIALRDAFYLLSENRAASLTQDISSSSISDTSLMRM